MPFSEPLIGATHAGCVALGRIEGRFRVAVRGHPVGSAWDGDMCLVVQPVFPQPPGPVPPERLSLHYRYGVDGAICTSFAELGDAREITPGVLKDAEGRITRGIQTRQASGFDRESPTPRRRLFQVDRIVWQLMPPPDPEQWAAEIRDMLPAVGNVIDPDTAGERGRALYVRRYQLRNRLRWLLDRARWFLPDLPPTDLLNTKGAETFRRLSPPVTGWLAETDRLLELMMDNADQLPGQELREQLAKVQRELASEVQSCLDSRTQRAPFNRLAVPLGTLPSQS